MARKSLNDAMLRLSRAESAFVETEFLAPAIRGQGVVVAIAGVRCTLALAPADFEGWGVFRARSLTLARLIRPASGIERTRYLALFAPVRGIVLNARANRAVCVPANEADDRFQLSGVFDIRLSGAIDTFETIAARFDGTRFWFDRIDSRADPAIAAYLRRALSEMTEPEKLDRAGLTSAARDAYALAHARRAAAILADVRSSSESRLKAALAQAGARLADFSDAGDVFRVTYSVDGRRHLSVVNKADLTIQSARICLAGEDAKFDLNSLVGVMREAVAWGR